MKLKKTLFAGAVILLALVLVLMPNRGRMNLPAGGGTPAIGLGEITIK